ncbi:hypothetical protein JNUCC0626_19530 [Lentzea sp. JNUCC 0626]|uniref:hypothetical protein n=1 Tax=Lentzea sp. JNUCC 0626 TaxID=3367513 RepID=UPI003747E228
MSFTNHARHVRDPGLPYRHRVSALRSCVQLYRPIGFNASLTFLALRNGPYYRDEAALLHALDDLSASRAGWHAALREYAVVRTRAKRLGQRSPRPADDNPNGFPPLWYGAARPAALHALRYWRLSREGEAEPEDQALADVELCVTAALASGGPLTPEQQEVLATCTSVLHQRMRSGDGYVQPRVRAWDLLKVTRHVEVAGGTTRSGIRTT